MELDFFDPSPEEQNVVLVSVEVLRQAEQMIESCEHCNRDAEIPFDWILDRMTANRGSMTDYILNGIDPEAYLSHVLARIADHPITRI